ncbi:MAG TPA: hypothetical protein VGM36_13710 [Rhizomicrobium sp.]
MDKIPVGRTIGHAYSFAFKKFFSIIGLIWFPFAILVAGVIALGFVSADAPTALVSSNPAAMARIWFLLLPFYVFATAVSFMLIVGIMQFALGLRPPTYFYFSLGKPVWKLLAAFILVILLMIAFVAVFAVGALLIGMVVAALTGVKPGVKPTGGAAALLGIGAFILFAVVYCGFIYGLVRQTFFLTPVVVAEDRIGLGRAWKLGRGNFWRMFVILVAVFGPIVLVEVAVVFGFIMHGLPPTAAQGATPEQIMAWNAQNVARIKQYWFVLAPAYFVFLTIIYGLLCGAQAFAYRSLVPVEKAEDVF